MPEPVHIAAIDAGSNAVRLSIARAYSALDIEPLTTERYPLRLGEGVFVRHRFSEELLNKGVKAFRRLREIMDDFGVTKYRAVATSATREAQNRSHFRSSRQASHRRSSGSDQRQGRIPPRPRRRAGGHGPRRAAALHRRSRRRQPGTQHPSRSQRRPGRATSHWHRAADDHAGHSRRNSPPASRTGAPLCARAAGIASCRTA